MLRSFSIPIAIFLCSSAHQAAFFRKRKSILGLYSVKFDKFTKQALAISNQMLCIQGQGPKQIQVFDLQQNLLDKCQRTNHSAVYSFYKCGKSQLEFSHSKNLELFDQVKVVKLHQGNYGIVPAHIVSEEPFTFNQNLKGVGIKDREAIGLAINKRFLLNEQLSQIVKKKKILQAMPQNSKKSSQLGISIKSASQENGALVVRVSSESPLAGRIFLGNIIKQVNGKAINSAEQATELLKQGGKLRMKIKQESGFRQVVLQL